MATTRRIAPSARSSIARAVFAAPALVAALVTAIGLTSIIAVPHAAAASAAPSPVAEGSDAVVTCDPAMVQSRAGDAAMRCTLGQLEMRLPSVGFCQPGSPVTSSIATLMVVPSR